MYRKKAHIHFVGIGGIGMSGIAKILKAQGYFISGCDIDLKQKSVDELTALGCTIYDGNNTPQCQDESIDILVYSSAIHNTNPEIEAAQKRGIPTIPRALMLAELMRIKYSIAIAGSHGKTTTTSLISHIFMEARFDPTVIIGGHLTRISSNAHYGEGDYLIAEADESDRSLVRLHPSVAVLTNIDLEHLDVYKDVEDVKNTFAQFLQNVPFYGKAILGYDDAYIRSLLPLKNVQALTFGLDPNADYYAEDIALEPDHTRCVLWQKRDRKALGELVVSMPGKHNLLNALAAAVVALEFDIPFGIIADALSSFKGVERRFYFKGLYKGAELFDDYGHHPTEVDNVLTVARRRSKGRLIVVFQPQRYSRTHLLWNEFINAFGRHQVDSLVVTDIHAASEKPIAGVTSARFVEELKHLFPEVPATYLSADHDFLGIEKYLKETVSPDDLVLFLGAGKVNKLAERLVVD